MTTDATPALARGAPVAPEERVVALDALRGFALLGIALVNITIMAYGFWNLVPLHRRFGAWWDQAALAVVGVLVAGKANSLFSFLFGLGFTLQLRRLDERAGRGVAIYLRRLAVLFAFGLAHALLVWSGDVLHHYAVLGLLLLALRKVPRRWLFALMAVAFLVPQSVRLSRALTATPERRAEREAVVLDLQARSREAYAGGSYASAVRMRVVDVRQHDVDRPVDTLDWLTTLGLTALIGLHFGRERLIERAAERADFWARLQRWSLALGLASGLLSVAIGRLIPTRGPTPLGVLSGLLFDLCRPTLMLFYVSAVVRLARRRPGARWLAPVAAAGRMPLTNYVMQSVLGTFVFYGHGLGLYGEVAPLACYGVAAAIWGVEVAWSRWWQRRFLFGPGEWLWRVLTYGRRLPIRRPAPAAAAAAGGGADGG
ncbi:MAG TPA: DUF418 domain-containing protein [Polyangiaceae bacterium]|nr:DUF418 domain-containing protein [Polyangiaceae bacterium]